MIDVNSVRSSRVLEIGAGTGLATKRLAGSAARVVAVEPSQALVEQLRANMGTVGVLEVVVAPFEDVVLSPGSFDLVVAATAFHWLDPEVALPKIGSVLRPGG